MGDMVFNFGAIHLFRDSTFLWSWPFIYIFLKIDLHVSNSLWQTMNTESQNRLVGCIMIVFALGIAISSVLLDSHRRENAQIEMGIQQDMAQILYTRQSIDALHQAVQYTTCTLLQAKWSADTIMTTILKAVEHAMNSTAVCPIY